MRDRTTWVYDVLLSAFCGLDIDAHSGQHPYQDTYKIKKNSSNKKKNQNSMEDYKRDSSNIINLLRPNFASMKLELDDDFY